MQGATAVGMTNMPSMTLIQGTRLTDDVSTANRIGFVTHVVMMGTVMFGIGYAALFTVLGDAGVLTGAPATTRPEGDVLTITDGQATLVEPGIFAKNYGAMTPVGLVMGHVVFGVAVALVYTAIV